MQGYSLEVSENGIVCKGPVPMAHVKPLSALGMALGFDLMDFGVGQALGATMVMTSKDGSANLRKEIDDQNRDKSAEDAWLNGWDTGISSKTIFHVMTGRPWWGPFHPDVPHDPADFGRCFRLLEMFPAWRDRLGEVAAKYPRWKGLVENWGALEEIYRRDLEKGSSHELYEMIQGLIKREEAGRE